MKILIRVDGSKKIGFGHVNRMLSLMDVLKNHEISVILGGDNETSRMFKQKGAKCITTDAENDLTIITKMAKSSDLIIVDLINNSYSDSYFNNLRKNKKPIIAIDDCGNKKIAADILINGTIVKKWQKYPQSSAKMFIGPEYMLLNKRFSEYNKRHKKIAADIDTVTVTTGGSDMKSFSPKIAQYIASKNNIKKINVIQGLYFANTTKKELDKLKSNRKINIIKNCKNLTEIMYQSDLVILTAGVTAYECACIGTPFIAINQVSHQNHTSAEFEKHGICTDLKGFNKNTTKELRKALDRLTQEKRKSMSTAGKQLVDGKAVFRAKEIIENIDKYSK